MPDRAGSRVLDDFVEAVDKVIAAFIDEYAGYTRMPGWHSAEQMGKLCSAMMIEFVTEERSP